MDPYSQPSSTTVEICLAHWGTPKFDDEFLAELSANEDDLALEDLCQHGGSPSFEDNADLEDLQITGNDNGVVSGNFSVSFTEASNTSCDDIDRSHSHTARIHFTLRLSDGYVEFDPNRTVRECEDDEF